MAPIRTTTLIIGTGFAGLGMAIQLSKDSESDYLVLEKAADVGGTWRDNTYPGCACDVPSNVYSYSFEQNPDWTRGFSRQPEIWSYMKKVADKYQLREKIHFGQEVVGAVWDEDTATWTVSTKTGQQYQSRYVVNGIGALHIPKIPKLDGAETFAGPSFHSAAWEHDVDLAGKSVVVVGTGASAIQFVPQIAKSAAQVTLLQRSAPWVLAKPDFPIPAGIRKLFSIVPLTQRAIRAAVFFGLESRSLGYNGHPWVARLQERLVKQSIRRAISDPLLRKKVTPDYLLGCKRVLFSNDYYPALARPNVDVVTAGIERIFATGVVDQAGATHAADVIIYGTGFHVIDSIRNLEVLGRGGQDLRKVWSNNGVQTHLGITTNGFPNMFFLLGPNTGLGHNSVVFMIEQQISHVSRLMKSAKTTARGVIEVKEAEQRQYDREIQDQLRNGVWSTGGCTSWYLDSAGVNRAVWPGAAWKYWRKVRQATISQYEIG